MKKLLLILAIICNFNANSQLFNSSCIAKDSFNKRYINTVDLLTLRRTYWDNKPFKDSVNIDPKLSDTFYKCLATIYNIPNLKALDTIFRILYIKNDEWLDQIAITSDTNYLFTRNLRNNIFPTTNDTLDSIMNKYNYSIDTLQGVASYGEPLYSKVIKSTKNWNRPVIIKEIKNIKSIKYLSEGFGYINYNTMILDTMYKDYMILNFRYGWGDCPAGCTIWRNWLFKVYYDCRVEYLGSKGAKLPFENNSVLEQKIQNIDVYPNPSKDKIHLSFEFNTQDIYYTISDLTGKRIVENRKLSKSRTIEFDDELKCGLYFLILNDREKTISTKKITIIK
jgi:hypothetical protein